MVLVTENTLDIYRDSFKVEVVVIAYHDMNTKTQVYRYSDETVETFGPNISDTEILNIFSHYKAVKITFHNRTGKDCTKPGFSL